MSLSLFLSMVLLLWNNNILSTETGITPHSLRHLTVCLINVLRSLAPFYTLIYSVVLTVCSCIRVFFLFSAHWQSGFAVFALQNLHVAKCLNFGLTCVLLSRWVISGISTSFQRKIDFHPFWFMQCFSLEKLRFWRFSRFNFNFN